jgi:hypothetical protein
MAKKHLARCIRCDAALDKPGACCPPCARSLAKKQVDEEIREVEAAQRWSKATQDVLRREPDYVAEKIDTGTALHRLADRGDQDAKRILAVGYGEITDPDHEAFLRQLAEYQEWKAKQNGPQGTSPAGR